jgi:hypothetical protein
MQGNFPFPTPLLRGGLFAAIGLGAVVLGASYGIGAATAMGPGYFPVLAGGLLAAMGLADVVRGLRSRTERFPGLRLWPLACLAGGVVGFGLLIQRGGLLLSVAVLVGCAFLAAKRIRPLEALLLFAVLAVLSGALFVYGLGSTPRDLLPR